MLILIALAAALGAALGASGRAQGRSGGEEDGPMVIGRSVEGRPIRAYRVGSGPRVVVIVGGIHGGYEWNSVALAWELLDHYAAEPGLLPAGRTLFVVPNMNPDGLHRVTGGRPLSQVDFSSIDTVPGRFNARGVDLNRNWGSADWQPTSYWGRRQVDAGEEPFSEPETRALRDFLLEKKPELVVFYQSAANGIWYGGKPDQWEPAARLARAYSEGSGYHLPPAGEGPVDYEITGSASHYLYERRVPTLTIELATHERIELERNLLGLEAVFERLAASGGGAP